MADTISSDRSLAIDAFFYDDDTRKLTVPDAKEDLTEAQVLATMPHAAKVLVGDKAGADFLGYKNIVVTDRTIIKYDLSEG